MRGLSLAVLGMLLGGCLEANTVTCGGLDCPSGNVCTVDNTCATQEQVVACDGVDEGAACGTAAGFCHHGVCVEDIGTCGDGTSDIIRGETCDCGSADLRATPAPGCSGFNSDAPASECRVDCTVARCGDGIQDPDEQCDDGNNTSGDGCNRDCSGRFAKMSSPTANSLNSVVTLAPDNAYAVGDLGAALHFDGAAWSLITITSAEQLDYSRVFAVSPSEIYVVGSKFSSMKSSLYVGDGSTWTKLATHDAEYYSVWASGPDDIYMAGPGYGKPEQTRLIHWNGVTWESVTTPCASPNYGYSIAGTSASNLYVAAGGVCHWNGTDWRLVGPNPGTLIRTGSGDVAQFANGGLQTFTGRTASEPIPIPAQVFNGFATQTETLATGQNGIVMQLRGNQWTHLVVPTELVLNGGSASSDSNVFIVGASGTILH